MSPPNAALSFIKYYNKKKMLQILKTPFVDFLILTHLLKIVVQNMTWMWNAELRWIGYGHATWLSTVWTQHLQIHISTSNFPLVFLHEGKKILLKEFSLCYFLHWFSSQRSTSLLMSCVRTSIQVPPATCYLDSSCVMRLFFCNASPSPPLRRWRFVALLLFAVWWGSRVWEKNKLW